MPTGRDGHPYFCQVHPSAHACTTDVMRAALVSNLEGAGPFDLLAACRACLKAKTWPTLEYLPETPTGPARSRPWPKSFKGCRGRLYVGPRDANPSPPESRGAVPDGPLGHDGPVRPTGPACVLWPVGSPFKARAESNAWADFNRSRHGPDPLGAQCTRYLKLQAFHPARSRAPTVTHDHAHKDGGYFPCDGALEPFKACACHGCRCPDRSNPFSPSDLGGLCLSCATGAHTGPATLERPTWNGTVA